MFQKICKYIGVILSILTAITATLISLTISLKINENSEVYWAANFAKSILQDLCVSPFVTITVNFIITKWFIIANRQSKFHRLVSKSADENISYMIKLLLAGSTRKHISALTSPRDFNFQNDLNNHTLMPNLKVPENNELSFQNDSARVLMQPISPASISQRNPLVVLSQQKPTVAANQRVSRLKYLDLKSGKVYDSSQLPHKQDMKYLESNVGGTIEPGMPNAVHAKIDNEAFTKASLSPINQGQTTVNPAMIKIQDAAVKLQQLNPDTVKSAQLPGLKRDNFMDFILSQRKLKAGHFGS